MDDHRILVVKLTESFGDFWDQFARDVRVGILTKGSKDPISCSGTTVAIVLAAGGAEQDVSAWLQCHEIPAATPLFAVGADPSRRTGIKLVSRGATDYFAFPEDLELLRNAVQASIERLTHAERRSAQAAQKAKAKAFNAIIGESPALKDTLSRAECILARPDTSALIMGETGTGKELLVRALHEGGPRAARPFVAVNCSALPNNLVESEFFGHERGAFTDAHAAKPGLFEIADGGTLFLDELGTLPLEVQAKLLRVLEDGEIRRVGATKSHRVNVRVMAATNEKLDEALAAGSFRQDLYFRLGVITLVLPPLRERGDDVLLIAKALLAEAGARHGTPAPELTTEVTTVLRGYHWPGNIRELKNALERALLLSPEGRLNTRELLPKSNPTTSSGGPIPFPAELDEITGAAVRATLDFCAGNRSEAARRLGVSRQRLRRLLNVDRGEQHSA